MIKYFFIAILYKFFSISSLTKKIYRYLGNIIGARRRAEKGLTQAYLERASRFLNICRKYDVFRPGSRAFEIGTGWVHWESIFVRLFYDVEIALFDVWDGRQFKALKRYFGDLAEIIDEEIHFIDLKQHVRVHNLLKSIASVSSFHELYDLLSFRYIVDSRGFFYSFKDVLFDCIFSANVLQHVKKDVLPEYISEFYHILKPGGYSIHLIDIGDMLSYHVKGVSFKKYLSYSDVIWKRCFDNDIEHINRVQRSEYLAIFQKAGFELVEEEFTVTDLGSLVIDKMYEKLSRQDLECRNLWLVHRKRPQ
ncbi:MAG: class I SAM-dependent methyltransferase [Candidatus Omnitrophica bacterium]|nr:class I SAM-dependent methyltransferase [Candidatus Omnitrophota bacterium]